MSRLGHLRALQTEDRARLRHIRARIHTRRSVIERLISEQGTLVMFDDVDLSQIPAHAEAVAGYMEGALIPATYPEVVKRWPQAKHLSIAVTASEYADCLDVEKGDAAVNQAPWWFHHRWSAENTTLPWIYISAAEAARLIGAMAAAGIPRSAFYLFSAHYTHEAHICGPHTCGYPQANGTQYTNLGLGRPLDMSKLQRHGFIA